MVSLLLFLLLLLLLVVVVVVLVVVVVVFSLLLLLSLFSDALWQAFVWDASDARSGHMCCGYRNVVKWAPNYASHLHQGVQGLELRRAVLPLGEVHVHDLMNDVALREQELDGHAVEGDAGHVQAAPAHALGLQVLDRQKTLGRGGRLHLHDTRKRVPTRADMALGGGAGRSLRGKERKGFTTPTETNVHRDALCFLVKTWARHKTTETIMNSGRRLAAVGGWRLAAVSGWWSSGAVLNQKKRRSEGQPCVGGVPSIQPRGVPRRRVRLQMVDALTDGANGA